MKQIDRLVWGVRREMFRSKGQVGRQMVLDVYLKVHNDVRWGVWVRSGRNMGELVWDQIKLDYITTNNNIMEQTGRLVKDVGNAIGGNDSQVRKQVQGNVYYKVGNDHTMIG